MESDRTRLPARRPVSDALLHIMSTTSVDEALRIAAYELEHGRPFATLRPAIEARVADAVAAGWSTKRIAHALGVDREVVIDLRDASGATPAAKGASTTS